MPGKLTEQPVAGVGTEDDLYLVVQSVQSRKQTRTQLRTGILSAWQSFIRTFLGAANAGAARTAIGAQAALTFGTGTETFLATPSSANLRAAITDETGSGALVFGTAPTIAQPNLVGVTGASNAAAGSVGEYVSATLALGSATSLVTATAKTVTSISLTAGDWEVCGTVGFSPAGGTTITQQIATVNTSPNALQTSPGNGSYAVLSATHPAGNASVMPTGTSRLSLAATTTVYLVAQSNFSGSTNAAYGFIGARRVR
jgi:hypothetical protein